MLWAMQNVEQHCGELPKNAPSSLNRRLAKLEGECNGGGRSILEGLSKPTYMEGLFG